MRRLDVADGTYERRGPREAELSRFRRLLAEAAARRPAQAVPFQTNTNQDTKEHEQQENNL